MWNSHMSLRELQGSCDGEQLLSSNRWERETNERREAEGAEEQVEAAQDMRPLHRHLKVESRNKKNKK
jgi:hypothetical protein